ncbi:MAG: nitronate monooxygenase [Bacillaceae bacterium]|nr:nitronate monooxygenase [Bacillaceae bacterium]
MRDICELLTIRYPIIQGGMGNISNAPLTAAVSEAGGLGTIGAGTMTPEEVESIIIETKERTDRPFAVNIPLKVTPYLDEIVEIVLKHQVPCVSLSAGNPRPFIPVFKEKGMKVITVSASIRQGKKAEEAGADIIVAEGYEAAGINSNLETTTLTLIPQMVQAVDIPVVAAGGIGDGKGLAAMLVLGASGVQMGTRFIATKEAPFHQAYKQKILEADDHGTVIVGRSYGQIRRLMKIPYAEMLLEEEKKGMEAETYRDKTSEKHHRIGALQGDFEQGFINGGQISGLINHIPSVSELMEQMMEEARSQLEKQYFMWKDSR